MDGKNSKKKYESPMIIELGQVPVVQGHHKPYCSVGGSADLRCSIGNSVAVGGSINITPQVEQIEPNYEKIQPGLDSGNQPRIEPKLEP